MVTLKLILDPWREVGSCGSMKHLLCPSTGHVSSHWLCFLFDCYLGQDSLLDGDLFIVNGQFTQVMRHLLCSSNTGHVSSHCLCCLLDCNVGRSPD